MVAVLFGPVGVFCVVATCLVADVAYVVVRCRCRFSTKHLLILSVLFSTLFAAGRWPYFQTSEDVRCVVVLRVVDHRQRAIGGLPVRLVSADRESRWAGGVTDGRGVLELEITATATEAWALFGRKKGVSFSGWHLVAGREAVLARVPLETTIVAMRVKESRNGPTRTWVRARLELNMCSSQ